MYSVCSYSKTTSDILSVIYSFCTCELQSFWRWTTHGFVWVHSRNHRGTGCVTRQHRLRSSERDWQLGVCYFQRKGALCVSVCFTVCPKCMIYYAIADYKDILKKSRHPSSQSHRKLALSCYWHYCLKIIAQNVYTVQYESLYGLIFSSAIGHMKWIPMNCRVPVSVEIFFLSYPSKIYLPSSIMNFKWKIPIVFILSKESLE